MTNEDNGAVDILGRDKDTRHTSQPRVACMWMAMEAYSRVSGVMNMLNEKTMVARNLT